jgi:hypothetical protein
MKKWLDNYNDSSVSLPEGFVGEGIFNGPIFENPAVKGQFQNGGKKKPITTREDFEPSILSNIPGLTSLASGNQPGYNRQEQYGPLGDLYKYYGGQPLEHDVLVESQNKPSTSKDKNAKYISLNHDREFVNEVLDNYERVSSGKLDKDIESKLNDNSWSVSGYSSAGKDAHKTKKQGSEHHSNAIGRYTLGKGKDKKGEYISYYDKFDQGTGSGMNPGEALGLTKPFEIYDRIYLKDVNRKFQIGGVMPGAVGHMYARHGSPSKGPRRNQTDVTDASAQNGDQLNPLSYPQPDHYSSINPFLSRDPEYNMFIGGISPSYSTKDFSIGAHVVGVGNEDFRQLPADYGIRGSYNPSKNLSINAGLSKNNIGAGMRYRFENGGDIAQNGQEMQYYQQGLDWKPKTISQDGTKLDYHTGDKVTYGTPEYREAYNRGEVITDEGVRSPIQLDEVVIKGKKKDKNWLEQYASKIAEENRDAGLLGAIIGTPISAITSLPQLMGMKALTGEMQRPSEGLDIKNPYGAMAVDAIADPANLVGANILTKGKALSKLGKIPTSIAPELRQGLQTNGFLDMFKSKKPTNISGQDWLHKWNNDPITLNKIAKREKVLETPSHPRFEEAFPEYPLIREGQLADKELNDIKTEFINSISNERDFPINTDVKKIPVLNYEDLKINEPQTYKETINKSMGISPGRSKVYIDDAQFKNLPLERKESTKVHELTHSAENNGDNLTINEQKELLAPFDKNNFQLDRPIWDGKTYGESYYTEPTEIHARMNQGRFQLGLSPKDKFTEEMFDKVSKENDWQGMGKYIKDKKGFIDLMNNFWAVPPAVIGAGALQQTNQEEAPQMKKGGIIKDDRGQWDHPGEITEIGSNQITMQGVPYPVLGISDTGDTKLMNPGKNYKFKGKKVTEYPMAKNGVNQQDQKTLQQLDQLTNFTNYNKPQPGGWLNKYKS